MNYIQQLSINFWISLAGSTALLLFFRLFQENVPLKHHEEDPRVWFYLGFASIFLTIASLVWRNDSISRGARSYRAFFIQTILIYFFLVVALIVLIYIAWEMGIAEVQYILDVGEILS